MGVAVMAKCPRGLSAHLTLYGLGRCDGSQQSGYGVLLLLCGYFGVVGRKPTAFIFCATYLVEMPDGVVPLVGGCALLLFNKYNVCRTAHRYKRSHHCRQI